MADRPSAGRDPSADPGLAVEPGLLAGGPRMVVGPYPSLTAFCQSWGLMISKVLRESQSLYPPALPYCEPASQLTVPPAPLLGAQLFEIKDKSAGYNAMALRTDKGVYLVGLFQGEDYDDPHCGDKTSWELRSFSAAAQGKSARVSVQYRVVSLIRSFDDKMHMTGERTEKKNITVTCLVSPGQPPTCS